jgi:hypothetical protein
LKVFFFIDLQKGCRSASRMSAVDEIKDARHDSDGVFGLKLFVRRQEFRYGMILEQCPNEGEDIIANTTKTLVCVSTPMLRRVAHDGCCFRNATK